MRDYVCADRATRYKRAPTRGPPPAAQSASEPLVLLTADAKLGLYGGLVRVV